MMMVQHANERPWNSERKAPLGGRLHVGSRCDKWVVGESGGRQEDKRESITERCNICQPFSDHMGPQRAQLAPTLTEPDRHKSGHKSPLVNGQFE